MILYLYVWLSFVAGIVIVASADWPAEG